MRRQAKKFANGSPSDGSALILTVVLTSLLAMVGVLFVMMARVNQIATSGISESRELDSAIETVIAKISEELVLDVPGVADAEYYDYPGSNDEWLASLEPYDKSGVGYCWRHTSDIDGTLGNKANDLKAEIIDDYQNPSELEDSNNYSADADGDGVADSKWIELDDITSSKGKPIYAAIRIVDNGGMLNVNTAYKFDPTESLGRIDGSSQTQINLFALSERGSTSNPLGKLDDARYGDEPHNLNDYIRDVVWHYDRPDGNYTPFDIGDELKLRNRYILNYNLMTSRIEELWENVYDVGPRTPLPTSAYPFSRWPNCTILGTIEPNDYDYRHISTIYNMDRIIDPGGKRMVNVNRINDINDVNSLLYPALLNGLDPCLVDADKIAAQIAVNLKDYRDSDSDVTFFVPDVNGPTYYGFERPCVYISELAHRFSPDPLDPTTVYRSYAIELYKPYFEDNDPNGWRLVIDGTTPIDINNWSGLKQYCVILNQSSNPSAQLAIDSNSIINPSASLVFTVDTEIELQRPVAGGGYVVVDKRIVPNLGGDWLLEDGQARSVQRDIKRHKCIRHLWASTYTETTELGGGNTFVHPDSNMIQAHPANTDFTNVGEIGMVLRKSAYSEGPNAIGQTDTEATARINLAESRYQSLFQYLTVFDPANDGIDNDGDTLLDNADFVGFEWKVPGRININTAPWFVLAQLPWVSQRKTFSTYELAKEIVGYRDEIGSFESIGQLCQVGIYDSNDYLGIDYYSRDDVDQAGFPDLDLPSPDGAEDDFEERDLIFARISNLVTVRSDVFTAYILVRIGTDGPQKRVIAILDRSGVYSPTDRVKIVAVHPVADPR